MRKSLVILAVLISSVSLLIAQNAPRLSGVEPASGKAGTTATLTGENLGKGSVSAVYLSDANSDFKAVIVEQSPEKIVIKIPDVKAGNYNVSLQVKGDLFIQPTRYTVE